MTHELWVLSAIFGALVTLVMLAWGRNDTLSEIASGVRAQGTTLGIIERELGSMNNTLSVIRDMR